MGRNNDLHTIDKLCRKIINSYPESLKISDLYFRGQKILPGLCPDWCALPSALIALCVADSKDVQSILNAGKKEEVYQLTSALMWSRNKVVYQYDSVLADTLATQSLDGKIPTDIFDFLPYPCVYIERKISLKEITLTGYFAWLDIGGDDNKKILRLLFTQESGYAFSTRLPILGGTILESILDVANKGVKGNAEILTVNDVQESPITQLIIECVNLLLYLCSEKPDLPDFTEQRTRRSRDSFGNPKRAAVWEVGTRIGAALRKARVSETEYEESKTNETSRATLRPHMRRAHWHSFWIGKRDSADRKLILRWLPPMAVKIDVTELPSVVTPIRSQNGGLRDE